MTFSDAVFLGALRVKGTFLLYVGHRLREKEDYAFASIFLSQGNLSVCHSSRYNDYYVDNLGYCVSSLLRQAGVIQRSVFHLFVHSFIHLSIICTNPSV